MNWLWDLVRDYPWLWLVVLGGVGQLFTPNPKKRKEARERERQRRMQSPRQAEKPRTDADDVAERIRELFLGKTSDIETLPVEPDPPQALDAQMPVPLTKPPTKPVPGKFPRERISRIITEVDIAASHAYDIKQEVAQAYTLDAVAAIRAMIVLGPPRALASHDEDPLLSLHQRQV